jgi:hypothetical protein
MEHNIGIQLARNRYRVCCRNKATLLRFGLGYRNSFGQDGPKPADDEVETYRCGGRLK